ncbi:MAG: hypothetical protein E6K81_09560 [Candidatus Eisenbacteria bacterium]|uniref:Uncharacterized protein n=1 Tax=Eiseniibacteriota bacterium TaxID=2212470 RepID=A0A538U7J7_UNCEI|nr:MAG: hypothetical protein E6K81_09560 [Candidatus Eisenbacteria bacterium]
MDAGRVVPVRSAAGLILLAATLLATPGRATSLRHLDVHDLTLESSDIVIGVVEGSRSYWNDARTRILTDVDVRVTRSLKGNPGARLTLTQLGGEVDGARYTVPGCPAFQAGEEALFFVWRDARGRAQVNGLGQGKFDIRRDPATGVRTVQRAGPGFAVRDVRALRALPAGEAQPQLLLDDLIAEIGRALADGAGRAPPR